MFEWLRVFLWICFPQLQLFVCASTESRALVNRFSQHFNFRSVRVQCLTARRRPCNAACHKRALLFVYDSAYVSGTVAFLEARSLCRQMHLTSFVVVEGCRAPINIVACLGAARSRHCSPVVVAHRGAWPYLQNVLRLHPTAFDIRGLVLIEPTFGFPSVWDRLRCAFNWSTAPPLPPQYRSLPVLLVTDNCQRFVPTVLQAFIVRALTQHAHVSVHRSDLNGHAGLQLARAPMLARAMCQFSHLAFGQPGCCSNSRPFHSPKRRSKILYRRRRFTPRPFFQRPPLISVA